MNIFFLDHDIKKCAKYHCDKHFKMILEYAQLLSTTCRMSGLDCGYKKTHVNHPCAKWCRESLDNWLWLRDLAKELNDEYIRRYNKDCNHKSYDMICTLENPNIISIGITKRPICMPEQYRTESVVESYRNFYNHDKRLRFPLKYTNSEIPEWLIT